MDKKFTILIVDDIPKNIQMAMNILKSEGYKMLYAQGGKQAFEIIQHNDIDLIFLDIMMPEMNGFEVCESLKKEKEYKDIPVVFLSGKDSNEDIEKSYEVGGIDYIVKPFINIELITKAKIYTTLKMLKELNKE